MTLFDSVPENVDAILNPGRMVSDGVPWDDVASAKQLEHVTDWFDHWARTAGRYEDLGDAALAAGNLVSAGEWLWLASIAWHYGQLMWFHNPEERDLGQRRKVELYRRAAPHLLPAAERIEVPFGDLVIPGYLRLPAGPAPHGCALLLGGLESTKEESYLFENLCLRRGLATFAFDGPGQGEMYFSVKLQRDFESYTSAVINAIEARNDIDADRLGVLGRSLGGHYALRSAAVDPRLKACVAWGGFYDMSDFDHMPASTKKGFTYVSGQDNLDAGKEHVVANLDLGDVIDGIECPTHILQGHHDRIFPPHQTELLRAALAGKPSVEIQVEPDGDHCCHNMGAIVRPRLADWLAWHLGAK